MDTEQFVREFYTARKGTNSIKWDILGEAYGNPDLLPLWVADMDFKTCPAILDAMRRRIGHGAFGYSFRYFVNMRTLTISFVNSFIYL